MSGSYRNLSRIRGNANCLGYYNPFAEEPVRVTASSLCCDDQNCCACGPTGTPLQRLYPANDDHMQRPFKCYYSPVRTDIPAEDPQGDFGMNCSGYSCQYPPIKKTEFIEKTPKQYGGSLGAPKNPKGQHPHHKKKPEPEKHPNKNHSQGNATATKMSANRTTSQQNGYGIIPPTRRPLAEPTRKRGTVFGANPVILPETSLAYGIPPAWGDLSP